MAQGILKWQGSPGGRHTLGKGRKQRCEPSSLTSQGRECRKNEAQETRQERYDQAVDTHTPS